MPASFVEYLTIDGQRYRALNGKLTRTKVPLYLPDLAGKQVQAPFVDAQLAAFGGGIRSADLGAEATTYAAALGLEPAGAPGALDTPWLKVGRTLDASLDAAGAGMIRPLIAWRGHLYAGEQGSDSVYRFDGATWTLAADLGASTGGVASFADFRGALYAGTGTGEVYATTDGTTWGAVTPITVAASGVHALGVLVRAGDEQDLYLVHDDINDGWSNTAATLYGYNGTTALGSPAGSPLAHLQERFCRASVVVGGQWQLAGAESGGQARMTLYGWDGTTLSVLARLDGTFATAACEYGGATYWGCQRGELYAYAGGALRLARRFDGVTTSAIRGLAQWAGALWVAVANDTAARLELHRFDGAAWSLPHYVGTAQSDGGGLAAYGDALMTGGGLTGSRRRVYRVGAVRCATSTLDTPDAVYGVPTLRKRWIGATLSHSPLLGGQSVAVSYSTDGGATWTALGTNSTVGSAATTLAFPATVLATRCRLRFTLTTGAAQDLTLFSCSVRALPAPDAREVWQATLQLQPRPSGKWADGTADAVDAIGKMAALEALKLQGSTFVAVLPSRTSGGTPEKTMTAVFDASLPLDATYVQGADGLQLELDVRLAEV